MRASLRDYQLIKLLLKPPHSCSLSNPSSEEPSSAHLHRGHISGPYGHHEVGTKVGVRVSRSVKMSAWLESGNIMRVWSGLKTVTGGDGMKD